MKRAGILFMAAVWLTAAPVPGWGETATIAVAANFLSPLKPLMRDFETATGHTARIVSGSTGKLFAQIVHGAPFDVFLAADSKRPRLLEERGLAVAGSRFTYARGRLALWSADAERIDKDGIAVLKKGAFRHLALANPKTAPYGKAAQSTLQALKLWEALQPKLVQGESVAQAFQFAATGNAEAGFVALSQVLALDAGKQGSRWEVPPRYHDPIRQDAVLLVKGRGNAAATALMKYLKSPEARTMIEAFGYEITR